MSINPSKVVIGFESNQFLTQYHELSPTNAPERVGAKVFVFQVQGETNIDSLVGVIRADGADGEIASSRRVISPAANAQRLLARTGKKCRNRKAFDLPQRLTELEERADVDIYRAQNGEITSSRRVISPAANAQRFLAMTGKKCRNRKAFVLLQRLTGLEERADVDICRAQVKTAPP